MSRILAITPNPLLDFVTKSGIRTGKITRIENFRPLAGGKGINSGRVLAALGHDVTVLSFAGGDAGESLKQLITDDGMSSVMIATKARTRVGFESIDKSGVTALLENGFSVTRSEYLEFLKRAEDLAPRADLVILGGSMPDRNTVGLIAAILKICSTNGIQCWVDSYGPAMERALRGSNPPQLVKPNRQEYRACPNYRKSPEIHLTDGAKTIKVTTPKGLFNVTPPKIREICPIGSGDCYLGALAHSRLLGRPIDEQLRFAAAAGTANAALGANTFIQKKDIERFENAVKIENVSFRAKPIY